MAVYQEGIAQQVIWFHTAPSPAPLSISPGSPRSLPALEEGNGVYNGAIELCTDSGGERLENTFSSQEEDRKSTGCPSSSREMGNTRSAGQPFPSAGHL